MPTGPGALAAARSSASAWLKHVELALDALPEVEQPTKAVCLEAIPGPIAHLRLNRGVPECVREAAKSGRFCAVVQEPSAATAWVPRSSLPQNRDLNEADGVQDMDQGRSWCAMRVGTLAPKGGLKGPAPTGTANGLCTMLAAAGLQVRMVSAFGAELLLVPEDTLVEATALLADHGNAVFPASRVCTAVPWRAQEVPHSDATLARQLAGAWHLITREKPLGTVAMEYTEGNGPLRLQSPGGVFVELRAPVDSARGKERQECSSAGRCHIITKDSKAICTLLRAVDFQPPLARPAQMEISFGADSLEAVSYPECNQRELWARMKNCGAASDVVALELEAETPARKPARSGFWVFVGNRFARVLGPPHGKGPIGGTCCKSFAQLQKLRGGKEARYEVLEHYEADSGSVERPGLLRTRRTGPRGEKAGAVLYDAADESSGRIEVEKTSVVFTTPGGRKETWRILEWTFDPFVGGPAAADDASSSQTRARSQSTGSAGDVAAPIALASPAIPLKEEDDGEATDVVVEEAATTAPAAKARQGLDAKARAGTVAAPAAKASAPAAAKAPASLLATDSEYESPVRPAPAAAKPPPKAEPPASVEPEEDSRRKHRHKKDKDKDKKKKAKAAKEEEVVERRSNGRVKDKKKKKSKKSKKDKRRSQEEEADEELEEPEEEAAHDDEEAEPGSATASASELVDEAVLRVREALGEDDEDTDVAAVNAPDDDDESEPPPYLRSPSRRHSGRKVKVKARLIAACDRVANKMQEPMAKLKKSSKTERERQVLPTPPSPPPKTERVRVRVRKNRSPAIKRLLGEGRRERPRADVTVKEPRRGRSTSPALAELRARAPRAPERRERSRSRDAKKRKKARA